MAALVRHVLGAIPAPAGTGYELAKILQLVVRDGTGALLGGVRERVA